jgi:protein-disulfide isomerase
LTALVGVSAGAVTALIATPVLAEVASTDVAMSEMSIGSQDAPVVLHEYSSLTCPHCAAFHADTLPLIKKEYVDTGKVRIVYHDFPLDNTALSAMMIVRCSGPERNVDFFNMLYETQNDWSRASNPLGALVALARFYGMDGTDVQSCLGNQGIIDAIMAARANATDVFSIQSTPTFILDGNKIEGAQSFDAFKDHLDKALAAKGAQ